MKKRYFFLFLIISLQLFADSSLEFDGLNDHVRISSVMNIGNSSNTLEAWIKVPEVGTNNLLETERVGIIMGNYDTSPNAGWEIHDDGQLRMWWNKNSGGYEFYASQDLRDNAWHHIAFVRNVSLDSSFIYVDGVLDGSYPSAGPNLTFTTSFYIGADRRSSGTPYFHGTIDELRVWNTARTQAEIREYMCENVSGSTGLLAYYQMSNGSGTSLMDNTGNGYTGTLINMDNSDWVNNNQIPDGDGSTTPYQINGLNQLYWLSQNSAYWSSDFEQIIDITATATESWDGGAGFTPIGNFSIKFNGTYNGNDHTISGLTIDRATTDEVAFIGWTSNGSDISSLNLSHVDISGDGSSAALVGYNMDGNVSKCSSTGTVTGVNYVGGLVGQIANGTISECYSTASVSGSGQYVGGLNGLMAATVRDCYATGNVSGNSNVGGLIGGAFGGTTTSNSYSTGSVSGSFNVGGLIGYAAPEDDFSGDPAAAVIACFWDTEVSGNATSGAGTGKTTIEMKTLSTYTDAGWDFADESVNGSNDYWGINNEQHSGYPFLSWEDFTHNYSDTPLPVCLAIFEAKNDKGAVKLIWTTESEIQNLGYVLERKTGGMNWVQVASYLDDVSLEGHGTTTESHDYSYTDNDVIAGQIYEYRLSDVSESNDVNVLKILSITVNTEEIISADKFGISKAYPNPFNPALKICYSLTEAAQTSVTILDLQGKAIVTLSNTYQNAGSYELQWQAEDMASGMYLVEVVSGDKKDLQKVILSK